MSLHLTPSSDWDGWTPPDMDQISDIPTLGNVSDINELSSVIAEAAGPTSRRKKRRRTLSTTAVAAGPTSRRKKKAGRMRRKKAGRMIRTSKGGLWLDSRATLHSLVSKLSYAKVPLVRLLRR